MSRRWLSQTLLWILCQLTIHCTPLQKSSSHGSRVGNASRLTSVPSDVEDCMKLLRPAKEAGELLRVLPECLLGVKEVGRDLVALVDG